MRGAMPCLSADLTTHAVQRTFLPVVFENGKACVRVSIVAHERREVREREGFHRGAGAPSVKVPIVREGREG